MNKKEFLAHIDNCIENGEGLAIDVMMPDLPLPETILNPWENLAGKKKYYDEAYTDDLKLKSFKKIEIVAVGTSNNKI